MNLNTLKENDFIHVHFKFVNHNEKTRYVCASGYFTNVDTTGIIRLRNGQAVTKKLDTDKVVSEPFEKYGISLMFDIVVVHEQNMFNILDSLATL